MIHMILLYKKSTAAVQMGSFVAAKQPDFYSRVSRSVRTPGKKGFTVWKNLLLG